MATAEEIIDILDAHFGSAGWRKTAPPHINDEPLRQDIIRLDSVIESLKSRVDSRFDSFENRLQLVTGHGNIHELPNHPMVKYTYRSTSREFVQPAIPNQTITGTKGERVINIAGKSGIKRNLLADLRTAAGLRNPSHYPKSHVLLKFTTPATEPAPNAATARTAGASLTVLMNSLEDVLVHPLPYSFSWSSAHVFIASTSTTSTITENLNYIDTMGVTGGPAPNGIRIFGDNTFISELRTALIGAITGKLNPVLHFVDENNVDRSFMISTLSVIGTDDTNNSALSYIDVFVSDVTRDSKPNNNELEAALFVPKLLPVGRVGDIIFEADWDESETTWVESSIVSNEGFTNSFDSDTPREVRFTYPNIVIPDNISAMQFTAYSADDPPVEWESAMAGWREVLSGGQRFALQNLNGVKMVSCRNLGNEDKGRIFIVEALEDADSDFTFRVYYHT